MSSTCGGRFRIEDLRGGVSEAVTAGRKGVKKVGSEGTGWDGCGVQQTGSLEGGMGYVVKGSGYGE